MRKRDNHCIPRPSSSTNTLRFSFLLLSLGAAAVIFLSSKLCLSFVRTFRAWKAGKSATFHCFPPSTRVERVRARQQLTEPGAREGDGNSIIDFRRHWAKVKQKESFSVVQCIA
uniref:(northern house mosquito) hypothetical protein n=2 Tax=Culex pipiens TaxID=7175 RepID=A0A8D8H7K8_CULPI